MNLSKYWFILFLLVQANSIAQLTVDDLHYINRIDSSKLYFSYSDSNHSSILPRIYLSNSSSFEPSKLSLTKSKNKIGFQIYPIVNFVAGAEYVSGKDGNISFDAGAGVALKLRTQKWFLNTQLLPYYSSPNSVSDSIQTNYAMDLGTTRAIDGNFFQRNDILIGYQPHKMFTFLTGYSKHFFGEGYRSLLLSDNASNYPFFKVETSFRNIKYVNLYTIWNDNSIAPSNKSMDRMKFSSIHYVSWNITRSINVSVFESVVWQQKDSLVNRGFDIHYLNPVVFYRPVEYSTGSADNVLLGLNTLFRVNKNQQIYGQLILDEFLLNQIKSGNQWWGNKYGVQLGYKSNQFFVENLYVQTELNLVRPFTYSHKYSIQNYGHLNASVTHPVGANFYEALQIVSYKVKETRITAKLTYTCYGVDRDSINFGQNIFNSYSDREGDFGHHIMQGVRTNATNLFIQADFPIIADLKLYAIAGFNYRVVWTQTETIHNPYIYLGIKTRLWNQYQDF